MYRRKSELKSLLPSTLKRCTFKTAVGSLCGMKANVEYVGAGMVRYFCGRHSVGDCHRCGNKAVAACPGEYGAFACGASICDFCTCERCND